MAIFQKKHEPTESEKEEIRIQDFFDRITPSTVKFYPDCYMCGAAYHCVWAIREYPPTAEEQAILAHLGDRSDVTLHIYNRLVDSNEQRQIIQHAARKNRMMTTVTDVTECRTVEMLCGYDAGLLLHPESRSA